MTSIYIKPPRTMMELYRGLPEGTLVQLVNNEIHLYPSHTDAHQNTLNEVLFPLADYIESNKAGRLLLGPFDVYLDEQNAFQPDIIFALPENRYKFRHDGFYGAPDLVIEILEHPTQWLDQGNKKDVYERSGVKEYWLIDPISKQTQGFYLMKNKFQSLPSESRSLSLQLLNYTIEF